MTRYPLTLAMLFLAACAPQGEDATIAGTDAGATASAESPGKKAAVAKAVKETGEFNEFTYGWPREAAAIAKLEARLETELARDRGEAVAIAREDKAARGPDVPYNGHYFSKVWETQGDTPRLLSLVAQTDTFTGGAHGNSMYEQILWDRDQGAAIEIEALFADPAAGLAAISQVYCPALDRARVEKRGEPLPADGEDWLVGCPALADRVVAPVDADKDGRFELLRVLIDPYEAGPYAEGSYEVDVPVTDALRGLLKPEYRPSF